MSTQHLWYGSDCDIKRHHECNKRLINLIKMSYTASSIFHLLWISVCHDFLPILDVYLLSNYFTEHYLPGVQMHVKYAHIQAHTHTHMHTPRTHAHTQRLAKVVQWNSSLKLFCSTFHIIWQRFWPASYNKNIKQMYSHIYLSHMQTKQNFYVYIYRTH